MVSWVHSTGLWSLKSLGTVLNGLSMSMNRTWQASQSPHRTLIKNLWDFIDVRVREQREYLLEKKLFYPLWNAFVWSLHFMFAFPSFCHLYISRHLVLLEERWHLQGLLDLRQSAQIGLLRFKNNREQQALPYAQDLFSCIVSSEPKLVFRNSRDSFHLGTSHHIRKLKQHCSVNICFLRFSWNYLVV